MAEPARESSPHDRLVEAGVDIARDQGLGALTARALSQRTGQSPSALNYHLGGRDALLGLVQDRALGASADWREARLTELARPGAPAWVSIAGTIAGLIDHRAGPFGRWHLLLSEFEALAEQAPELAAGCRSEIVAMSGFWREAALALALGEDEEVAEVWTDLATGLCLMFRGEEEAATRLPWIVDATNRMLARMRGEPVILAADRAPGAVELLQAAAPASEGAQRILQAAIRVLAEKGADRLTQREVAAMAGLSLAAVTYFFRTKADLVAAAFYEMHRQISAEVMGMNDLPLGARLARATLDAEGDSAWRVRAMDALQLAAARDPSHAPIVRALRSTRGATSIGWLRSQGLEIDRLDAFLFSTAMSGVVQRTRLGAAGDRRAAMAQGERRLKSRLFGLEGA